MNLKKIRKFLLVVVAGIFGFFALCVLLLVLALPTPSEINKALTHKAPVTPQAAEKLQEQKSTTPAIINSNRNDSTSSETLKQDSISNQDPSKAAFESWLDDRNQLSTACSNMQNIRTKQMGMLDTNDFGKRFKDSFFEQSSDPLIESVKSVLKFVLIQPSMRALIAKALQAQTSEERSSLMQKTDFYYAAYVAYQEMSSNKENIEHVMDQSYLTMMLGRAIESNPNLVQDPQVLDYCNAIEKQLNDQEKNDFPEEKRAFSDFLAQSKIDPKSIGFDPNYQTHLQLVFNKNSFRIKGGWIEELFAKLKSKTEN